MPGRLEPQTVLIALGGGPRVRLARAIARRLTASHKAVRVRVAAGFGPGRPPSRGRILWLGARPTLSRELAACTVAIVGGGVSAYEACACGAAAVALSVVRAQRPTVAGLAAAGAIVDGGHSNRATGRVATRVVELALRLIGDAPQRRRLSRRGRRLVDGRGARRVARAVRALAHGSRTRNEQRETA